MPPTPRPATPPCDSALMTGSHHYGPATVCIEEQAICNDRQRADLTPRELQLLQALIARPGAVVAKELLLDEIGGTPLLGYRDRRVDVHVAALRRKFAIVAPGWRFIHTRVGVGYRFAAEQTG